MLTTHRIFVTDFLSIFWIWNCRSVNKIYVIPMLRRFSWGKGLERNMNKNKVILTLKKILYIICNEIMEKYAMKRNGRKNRVWCM